MSSSSRGEISITGDFIGGSTAIGILSIVYSPNNDSNIHYQFIHRSNIPNTTTVSNFPGGEDKVSIFVVEETGLPFSRSATTPQPIMLSGIGS